MTDEAIRAAVADAERVLEAIALRVPAPFRDLFWCAVADMTRNH